MTETEKFRTERLVARSWEIADLPLAMELWGDPAVTALIDSRGKLTKDQVGEKLRAEIERERSGGVQYWALFDRRNGEFVGCGGLRPWVYTPGEANFEVGFHLVKRCWGKGFATEAALGALEYAWEKMRVSKVYAGHHPDNRASKKILKKLGFAFIGNVFYEPTGLMHPSYVCKAPTPSRNTSAAPSAEFLPMVATSAARRKRSFKKTRPI
jgi:RimJ/RimL family protein N-acetyltransferase